MKRADLGELRREVERLEGAAYSIRRRLGVATGPGRGLAGSDIDSIAWVHAVEAVAALERLADRVRALELAADE